MAKNTEQYRGEDRTLEMIHERCINGLPEDVKPEDVTNWDHFWNSKCDEIAEEMKAEGLNSTAEFVLSYRTKKPNYVFASGEVNAGLGDDNRRWFPVGDATPRHGGVDLAEGPDMTHRISVLYDKDGNPAVIDFETIDKIGK